jgi:hypothetical protein
MLRTARQVVDAATFNPKGLLVLPAVIPGAH